MKKKPRMGKETMPMMHKGDAGPKKGGNATHRNMGKDKMPSARMKKGKM